MQQLNIKKLRISTKDKKLVDIDFNIKSATALIGQSGSGKSLSLKALLGMLPQNLALDLNYESTFKLDRMNIAFVPQNPFTSLSGMTKIKDQFFCENDKKEELLKVVGLDNSFLNKFPSQLSGGQLQRVIIAISLIKNPHLLLLDEPTTALDVENKQKILQLIKDLQQKLDILILFVTHDINSILGVCENIVIIKDGIVVEKGLTEEILARPKEKYTKDLISSEFSKREFRK